MTCIAKTNLIETIATSSNTPNKACRCCGNCVCKTAAKPADMADLKAYRSDIVLITVQADETAVRVIWSDGASSRFHFDWLRENDPSPCSRHPHTRERVVCPLSIDPALRPLKIAIDKAGSLKIRWARNDGGHTSRFCAGWLRAHAYSLPATPQEQAANMPAQKADRSSPAEAGWTEVMASDDSFYDWLENYTSAGWGIISGVPDKEGCAVEFGERIGVVRSSNFGFSFDVRSKPQPVSNAYTSGDLPLHTDMPHYELPPGLQILHTLRNEANGGESLLADGLAVADHMRRMASSAYQLLTENSVPFRFQDSGSDYRARHPIFEHDQFGRLAYVNWSNSTSAPLDIRFDDMKPMRAAIRIFLELINSDRFLIQRKLKAGEMLVFDNRRMLHGRKAFDPTTGDRHLQGCYLDTSEVESRREVGARRSGRKVSIAA